MVINLQKLIQYIDRRIDPNDTRTKVQVIVPIMHHIRNIDKIVVSGSDNFKAMLANDKIHFIAEYNNRSYNIYDDFYIYDKDPNDLRDMNQYMDSLIREPYENEGSWIAIYYSLED